MSAFETILSIILGKYIESIYRLTRIILNKFDVNLPPELERTIFGPTVDQRLEKIEEARNALIEGLSVIDELKHGAEQNKRDLEAALADLSKIKEHKETAENELKSIRSIMKSDIRSFQTLAGIPNISKERIIGFISGVIASIFASGVWWIGGKLLDWYIYQ